MAAIVRNPDWFVDDFVAHAARNKVKVSKAARALLLSIESCGQELDTWLSFHLILTVVLREMREVRYVLSKHGLDPLSAQRVLERELKIDKNDHYHDSDDDLYSSDDAFGNRSLIGNSTITRARLLQLKSIESTDLLAAFFDVNDVINPIATNTEWRDDRMHTPYSTLSHIAGSYRSELWISVDTVRKELNLVMPDVLRRERVEQAPAHVRNGLLSFFADNPHYENNCFIIMPFRPTPQLREIHTAMRSALESEGFKVLRADDSIYSENVFTNIEVFLHGSRFALSVFERMASDQHNANVALETGYVLGMGKDLCLLKEKSVVALPSDLQGRLYVEFDAFSITESVSASVRRWLRERRLSAIPR